MQFRRLFFVGCLLLLGLQSAASDTLSLRLSDADAVFLQQNLTLLAGSYNVRAADAQILQARLYPNPVFSADFNAYDPEARRAFHTGSTGQKAFSVDQILLLGGKRKTQVELARQNAGLARLELEDLLRNLKYTLRTSFYNAHLYEAGIRKYSEQLHLIDTILNSYTVQAAKGNIPAKDVVRLKSVALKLINERSELAAQLVEEQSRLRVLLRTDAYVQPLADPPDGRLLQPVQVTALTDSALVRRPDLLAAQLQRDAAATTLKLQRQLAVPDASVGASYDQRGGAFNNQINLGFSIGLPVWNRNRGAIAAAGYGVQMQDALAAQKAQEVRAEVRQAVENHQRSLREYQRAVVLYDDSFEQVFRGMSANFQRRNISLLEFVDFVESYTESIAELQRVQTQLALAGQRLNFSTHTDTY